MTDRAQALQKLSILVVEDNFLIAETIREIFEECGCDVLGPAPDIRRATQLFEHGRVDGAVLDINLRGEFSFPIAHALHAEGIPFLFLSGYDDLSVIPVDLRSAPRLSKPFQDAELKAAAAAAFASP